MDKNNGNGKTPTGDFSDVSGQSSLNESLKNKIQYSQNEQNLRERIALAVLQYTPSDAEGIIHRAEKIYNFITGS